MNQLVWWLAAYGVTFTLSDAGIFERQRSWLLGRSLFLRELVGCYFCLGFWVNALMALGRFWALDPQQLVGMVLLHAFAGATFVFGTNSLFLTLESNARNPPPK